MILYVFWYESFIFVFQSAVQMLCTVRERTILILPSKSKDAGIDQLELHRAIE